jgi:ATP phosphoribosyltransferase regulatory subunit
VAEPVRSALLALPELYGGVEVLDSAASRLPHTPEVMAALADLRGLAKSLADLPISFDLADLRGFNYHSGVVFAAYCGGHPAALALGGRYDRVGKAFGRGRAATGFSLDLRELARLVDWPRERKAILAPALSSEGLQAAVTELRSNGEIVMVNLPGHEGTWAEAGCDRQLVLRGGRWCVEPLEGE